MELMKWYQTGEKRGTTKDKLNSVLFQLQGCQVLYFNKHKLFFVMSRGWGGGRGEWKKENKAILAAELNSSLPRKLRAL